MRRWSTDQASMLIVGGARGRPAHRCAATPAHPGRHPAGRGHAGGGGQRCGVLQCAEHRRDARHGVSTPSSRRDVNRTAGRWRRCSRPRLPLPWWRSTRRRARGWPPSSGSPTDGRFIGCENVPWNRRIGIIKEVLGFRQFSLRGLAQVTGEWILVCLAYNIKRLHTLWGGTVPAAASLAQTTAHRTAVPPMLATLAAVFGRLFYYVVLRSGRPDRALARIVASSCLAEFSPTGC